MVASLLSVAEAKAVFGKLAFEFSVSRVEIGIAAGGQVIELADEVGKNFICVSNEFENLLQAVYANIVLLDSPKWIANPIRAHFASPSDVSYGPHFEVTNRLPRHFFDVAGAKRCPCDAGVVHKHEFPIHRGTDIQLDEEPALRMFHRDIDCLLDGSQRVFRITPTRTPVRRNRWFTYITPSQATVSPVLYRHTLASRSYTAPPSRTPALDIRSVDARGYMSRPPPADL
jgi:hypothetical protein